MAYIAPLARIIEEFAKMPGIGHKTAVRLAFYVLKMSKQQAQSLIEAISSAKEGITYCGVCQNLTDVQPCAVCMDNERERGIICVVESAKDVLALERVREFNGLYHVLHGVISPMDGVGPEDIKLKELIVRLTEGVNEVIIATNPTIEGEATAMYLARLIKPLGIKVSRIAHGIPVGGDLEYADEITLSRAMEGRREL